MVRSKKKAQLREIGILILRIGLGLLLILRGYPKVFGGPEQWIEVGLSLQYINTEFAPMFFGFIIGVAELFGGFFLLAGLFFTPTLIVLLMFMIFATVDHVGAGQDFLTISHTIELGIVFLSLLLIGPGKHSLDEKLNKRRRRRY